MTEAADNPPQSTPQSAPQRTPRGRRRTKAPGAFRTIGEVATDLEVPQHVLRFWESKFTQVKPLKRGWGRRYYRPEDVDLLRGIRHLLYSDGYTIKGVQKLLREIGSKCITESGRSLSGNSAGSAASVAAGRTRRQSGAALPLTAQTTSIPAAGTAASEATLPVGAQGELDIASRAGAADGNQSPSGLSAQQRDKLQALAVELGEIKSILRQTKK